MTAATQNSITTAPNASSQEPPAVALASCMRIAVVAAKAAAAAATAVATAAAGSKRGALHFASSARNIEQLVPADLLQSESFDVNVLDLDLALAMQDRESGSLESGSRPASLSTISEEEVPPPGLQVDLGSSEHCSEGTSGKPLGTKGPSSRESQQLMSPAHRYWPGSIQQYRYEHHYHHHLHSQGQRQPPSTYPKDKIDQVSLATS
ncbi:unnamed protein product [Protopolystoma xenopodis]|uniref:Uncharacterized protein n=1 Tax=Protopolystoma xenopodis TaxID=117903 RepID=A0A448X3G7_9PLAT|nr:unnamed protein product [Protopolystoma xenopodis]